MIVSFAQEILFIYAYKAYRSSFVFAKNEYPLKFAFTSFLFTCYYEANFFITAHIYHLRFTFSAVEVMSTIENMLERILYAIQHFKFYDRK